MENEHPSAQYDEGRSSRRGRLMGKLFGAKDRKMGDSESGTSDLNDFFHSSSDTLQVTHAPPPPAIAPRMLAKLDTSKATRYPQALNIDNRGLAVRPSTRSPLPSPGHSQTRGPRPNRKGFVVRFVDTWPEIIGVGGDDSEEPTIELSRRKRAAVPPPQASPLPPPPPRPPNSQSDLTGMASGGDDFMPRQLKRSQTGYSSIPEPPEEEQKTIIPGLAASARYLESSRAKDENRRSFIEIHQAEMREAEGMAFAAARTTSTEPKHEWEETRHSPSNLLRESPKRTRTPPADGQLRLPALDQSPASVHSIASLGSSYNQANLSRQTSVASHMEPQTASSAYTASTNMLSRQTSTASQMDGPPTGIRQQPFNFHDIVVAAGDDAFDTFITRTRHLFELFRLHAEALKPLSSCALEELARAALWWFIKGRMGLEMAIRDRNPNPQGQMQLELDRQQAYANLAKGFWLSQEAISEVMEARRSAPDPEIEEIRTCLFSSLKKLSVSMKRNGFLPPEEAFLPQTIDKSIWVEYPPLSQDVVALLTHALGSAMSAVQRPSYPMGILESLPLGDSPEFFNYSRIAVDVFLMEQGVESRPYVLPCLLSTLRPQTQPNLVFILSSQNGDVQLRIQGNKNIGPVWEDVRWRSETNVLDIRLPRGFKLEVRCTLQDFRMLWSMYDFGKKVQGTLYPREDEQVAFRSTLPGFQYFDSDPQSRVFPKDPVSFCDVALFEKIAKEGAATGPRTYHRGFRVAVVTGPQTRTLSGVNHSYPSYLPIQFGFLRGEQDAPALLLKFDHNRQRGSMVLSFNDDKERVRFQALLIGTALHHDERVYAEVPLERFAVSQRLSDADGLLCFRRLPWKGARVVNDVHGGETPDTVLSDRLRILVDFKNGTVTDRVNVAPGELKLRLGATNSKVLHVLRQPQADLSTAVSEAQVPKELPRDLGEAHQVLSRAPTIRSYYFQTLKDLHDFQAALTGFAVMFDSVASAFAIARRRMVVPIHKKWEAGYTRIQVVQHDKVIQILAFFEDFHHGRCMNFVLKGTDVFETFHRSGRAGLKIVDAKFPLPQVGEDGRADSDEPAFVCLDLPEIPGEHDDISIMFENEADRDRLCQCLPAPVKGSSRLSRIK